MASQFSSSPMELAGYTFPVLNREEMEVLSVLCFSLGFAVIFFAYKFPYTIVITIGGFLTGLFAWNELVPQFQNDMWVCFVGGCVLSMIGAVVGGVVALLIDWLSVSLCLGVICGLVATLADGGRFLASEAATVAVFFVATLLAVVLASRHKQGAMLLMTSMAGALLLVYAADCLIAGGLLLNTGVVLQGSWPEDMHCYDDCYVPELLLVWLVLSVIGVMVQGQLGGVFPIWTIVRNCGTGYRQVPGNARTAPTPYKSDAFQRTFHYPDNQDYNYFDPAKLPPHMEMYSETVYSCSEQLANFFGFQDDNVRNQAEHVMALVANHRRYAESWPLNSGFEPPPATGVHSYHTKLFENYRQWCENLHVATQFIQARPTREGDRAEAEVAEVEALLTDIMLMMFIWGEAANLRHMPESLCFLYHKMMQEYAVHRGSATNSLYAGYFLDHVVTPMWHVVVRNQKIKGDHVKARNYDDLNEFFWAPQCLAYSYRDVDPEGIYEAQRQAGNGAVKVPTPVAQAMSVAPKTFLEKRSFLSTLLTFNRVFEFHFVTFHICTCFAFAEMLVWEKAYKVHILSSVFILVNALGLFWCLLEVWQAFPGINITGTAKCGFLVRLGTRYLILVYQVLYFLWSVDAAGQKEGMQGEGTPAFWWWQYLWLSGVVLAAYMAEGLLQLLPPLASFFCTRDNDYVNAFLNILYPLSRLYVGKRVHVSVMEAWSYVMWWGSLLVWKMYFSYQYEVKILIIPSLELFDDYINYPNQSAIRTFLLIILRWIPQVIIYIIDTSIWYAAWSAVMGSLVGFQDRLGEVRDFNSIRAYFMRLPETFCSRVVSPGVSSRDPSFAEVAQFTEANAAATANAANGAPNERSALLAAGNAPARMRQGFLKEFLDVRTQKWAAFAAVWNEIVNQMRHSDIISNYERDMLKFHSFGGFSKPVYLPIFQTAGSVEKAQSVMAAAAQAYNAEDDPHKAARHEVAMRAKLQEDVTVAEALQEVWELGMWLVRQLLGPVHDTDLARFAAIWSEYINSGCSMKYLKLEMLSSIIKDVSAIVSSLNKSLPKRVTAANSTERGSSGGGYSHTLKANGSSGGTAAMKKSISASGLSDMSGRDGHGVVDSSSGAGSGGRRSMLKPRKVNANDSRDKTRDDVREKLRPLLNSLKTMIRVIDEKGTDVLDRLTFILSLEQGFMWDDTYASNRLDSMAGDKKVMSILGKLYGLLCVQLPEAEPSSAEAKRRLAFFTNSLFMDMPRAPPIGDMLSWTVMTPFYSEDVMYTREELEARNEDGLTTLMYQQALYKNDWSNFLERLDIQDEQLIWSKKYAQETRLWASLRAQTLSRTVEGMMYYEAALRLFAHLEKIKNDQVEDVLKQKFQYVVACQVYGRMKKNADPKASDIDRLLIRFPNLRVAYIDEVRVTREGQSEFFSVLIKAAADGLGEIEEVYRVKLPGNPVVGEGKPENQNHAIIFSRGEYVQAIDMNQEGYFEEALKMRNLLEEFRRGDRSGGRPGTTIVGFREHVFTGAVSSLANYMALQELSFVTLGQRVLYRPLRIRMHYGHPDLFDKVFFMTRGGISKASKGINLSEDIFAGYNNCIRGGQTVMKEYTQVGKGRDVGMQQIYKFEAKLSQGAAEQSLSRDVNRLGSRLDFFRLLSFYFGGLGYYIGNYLTVVTITFVVYFMLGLAVFSCEKIGERKITPEGNLQILLAGMGVLNTLPMLATIMVEKGVRAALSEVLHVFISGGPFYFMFHIQTRAHYFYQTLLAGGAQYRATGRGFVTHHSCFDDLYRFFANSHFYLGFELATALILMKVFTHAHQYPGRTWSLWLAALSFIFPPFWFNPLSFEWDKVAEDYHKWARWISGNGGSASNSWEVWWREENLYQSRFSLGQKLQCLLKPFTHLVIGLGIGAPKFFKLKHNAVKAINKLGTLVLVLMVSWWIVDKFGRYLSPWLRRSFKLVATATVMVSCVVCIIVHPSYLKLLIGLYYVLAALCSIGLLMGFTFVRHAYLVHDIICGHILFLALFLLAALQIPNSIQTWLLFHNALSQGVVVEDILKYARNSQETTKGEDSEDLASLKKRLRHQELMLQHLMNGGAAVVEGSLNYDVDTTPRAESFAPLRGGGDGDSSSTSAPMMQASRSTLNLSAMAHGGGMVNTPRGGGAGGGGTEPWQFSAPTSFPPRDS